MGLFFPALSFFALFLSLFLFTRFTLKHSNDLLLPANGEVLNFHLFSFSLCCVITLVDGTQIALSNGHLEMIRLFCCFKSLTCLLITD